MSTHSATRSRWMDWKPRTRISVDSSESEPTKPSKPGSVGFDGANAVESSEIEPGFVGFEGAVPTEIPKEPEPAGVTWEDWKARELNRLFQEQGVTGQPGRITAATVRDSERKARNA